MTRPDWRAWRAPALLFALGALNVAAGAFQLSLIADPAADSAFAAPRYRAAPVAIVAHIVSGIMLSLLAPLQFAAPLRRRWPRAHRALGRALVLSACAAALSALWMNEAYPAFGTGLKHAGVAASSALMLAALALGVAAIRSGDRVAHGRWMARMTAIALGPATQRLFLLPIFVSLGDLPDLVIGAAVWAGFLANLAVVEIAHAGGLRRNPPQTALPQT